MLFMLPTGLFAEDITKYSDCLGKEYKELEVAVKRLEDLMQAKDERLESYIPKQGFKDENFEAMCQVADDMQVIPKWLKALCEVYKLGQEYNKTGNNAELFGLSIIPNSGVNGEYRKYLRNTRKDCNRVRPLDEPGPWRLPSITGKKIDLIYILALKGWKKYCFKLKEAEKKVKALKDKCTVVPNITGLCLDKARIKLNDLLLHEKTDVDSKKIKDERRWEVFKQAPLPGKYVKKSTSSYTSYIKVKVRRSVTNITVKPTSWLDAPPGGNKQIAAKVHFKCGKPLDLNGVKGVGWKSNKEDVATVKNGKIIIDKDAKDGQKATVTVTYSSKSKQIPVQVKAGKTLKEIILKPQDATSLKSIDKRKKIKAFAVYADKSQKEITKLKETSWSVVIGKGKAFFPIKGELKVQEICTNSFTVTASYNYKGKITKSKPLTYKVHPGYAYVPRVIKRDKAVAVKMVKGNKLVPAPKQASSYNKNYAPGIVILQDPMSCVLAKKGSKVSLTINPDQANKLVKVPDLLGKTNPHFFLIFSVFWLTDLSAYWSQSLVLTSP